MSDLLREPVVTGVILGAETMSQFLRDYLTVAIFFGLAVALLAGVLSLGKLVRPVRPQGDKYAAYESGVDAVGEGWAQSPIRYYVFALLFVLFDVEAAFIFPWALRLEAYGWFGAIEMIVFVVLLALGLLYAWRKKVLKWI